MSTLQEIEKTIEQPPREEIFRLHEVIQHRFDDERDGQFAGDADSGLPDGKAEAALAEHRAGQSTPFPRDERKPVAGFWAGYDRLPGEVRKIADKQHWLWLENPTHPSVQFKKIGRKGSARITDAYRAVGVKDEDTIVWFWIGTHA